MTRHLQKFALVIGLLFVFIHLQLLSPVVTAGKDDEKGTVCNLSWAWPLALGYTSDQLIVIIMNAHTMGEIGSKDLSTCLCLYQVPDYSVYQNKMYLTGGRPILDVWPKLAGNGLTCDNRGMIISDGQYSYVFFAGGTVLFNINTKDVVKSRPENPGYWLISSMAKMTYYKYAEPDAINMTKNIYGGDSLLEAKSASQQSTYTICGADSTKGKNQTDLVARKGIQKCPFKMWWNGQGFAPAGSGVCGFSDGKNFYVMNIWRNVHIFAMDAFEGKLEQEVPFATLNFNDFVVEGSPPPDANGKRPDRGGQSAKKTAIIIVVVILLLLLLCALAAVGLFCLLKRKKDQDKKKKASKLKHRKSSRKRKGKGSHSRLSGSRSKSRAGSRGKVSSRGKVISRKSSRIRKARSKRSPPLGQASRSKAGGGKGMSRTSTKGASKTRTASKRRPPTA